MGVRSAQKNQQNLQWRPKLSPEEKAAEEKAKAEKKKAAPKHNSSKPSIADPKIFLGRWKDSLGNTVEVEHGSPPATPSSGKGKGKGGEQAPELSVKLTKTDAAGAEPKVLKIMVDPRIGRWRCGNGILDQLGYKGSGNNLPTGLSWVTMDGRISTWQKFAEEESSTAASSGTPTSSDKPSETSEEGTPKDPEAPKDSEEKAAA